MAWVTRELARNSECSYAVRPFYGQGGHVVFPAPSGLNGQTKRSERRPAGRARRAPAPGAGPQWAPRVPWGAQPKKQDMRIALGQRSCRVHFVSYTSYCTALACDAAARSATATPETAGETSAPSCGRTPRNGRRRSAPGPSAPALSACRAGPQRPPRCLCLPRVDRRRHQKSGI